MNITPRTLALSATVIWLVASVLAVIAAGPVFAAGVALAGALMLVNFALWVRIGRRLVEYALARGTQWPALLLYAFKIMVLVSTLGGLMWFYDPLAVIVGSSIIVAAVLPLGAVAFHTPLQIGEG